MISACDPAQGKNLARLAENDYHLCLPLECCLDAAAVIGGGISTLVGLPLSDLGVKIYASRHRSLSSLSWTMIDTRIQVMQ